MQQFERYWLFAALCLITGVVLLRLILRERITLQASLAFLIFLATLGAFAVFPEAAAWVASQMGFSLSSNFFLSVAIALLALLHLSALVTLSRVEQRSITLTQELAIIQERLDAVASLASAPRERSSVATPARPD